MALNHEDSRGVVGSQLQWRWRAARGRRSETLRRRRRCTTM